MSQIERGREGWRGDCVDRFNGRASAGAPKPRATETWRVGPRDLPDDAALARIPEPFRKPLRPPIGRAQREEAE